MNGIDVCDNVDQDEVGLHALMTSIPTTGTPAGANEPILLPLLTVGAAAAGVVGVVTPGDGDDTVEGDGVATDNGGGDGDDTVIDIVPAIDGGDMVDGDTVDGDGDDDNDMEVPLTCCGDDGLDDDDDANTVANDDDVATGAVIPDMDKRVGASLKNDESNPLILLLLTLFGPPVLVGVDEPDIRAEVVVDDVD